MKLRDFPLLTDENIDSEVIAFLRQLGFDVLDVVESGLQGSADGDLLRMAKAQTRVIVTHDADFGTLAVRQGEPVNGIVYLRPAHIDAKFTIGSLQAVLDAKPRSRSSVHSCGEAKCHQSDHTYPSPTIVGDRQWKTAHRGGTT